MAAFILGTFYAAMAAAGYVTELVFGGLGLIPGRATAKIPDQGVSWDYTTWPRASWPRPRARLTNTMRGYGILT